MHPACRAIVLALRKRSRRCGPASSSRSACAWSGRCWRYGASSAATRQGSPDPSV